MLYVFYRINAMLNPYSIYIWLHEVMDNMPWQCYYQDHTRPVDHIVNYDSHLHIIKGLEILRNWLQNWYLVEAMAEWRHLTLHSGSLYKMPYPRSYEDQWPGNKGPFYRNRGICPEIKPIPEDAPCVANTMLMALGHHNHQQSEARDRQEYQDNTESPITNFPSPTLVDQEELTNLDSLEGTTTAQPPSSPVTSAPPKKKITIQEYNYCKAAEEQRVAIFLDQDENGEYLDCEDFKPQDNPANIQIGYRTPMPVTQIPDLPPLQDTLSPASQKATTPATPDVTIPVTIPMPQDNTGPGTVPSMVVYNVATATNWAPGFGRGLPIAQASPMQIGTPAALLQRTPGHGTTPEEFFRELPCHALPSRRLTF